MKKSNLTKLLEENYLAYYWIGFLLADGSICDSRLKIGLALKDAIHLAKFLEFIEYETKKVKINISLMDTKVTKQICEKFDFKKTKTYNPPTIIPNNDFTLALIIGFIDGDGCINFQSRRTDPVIRIKNHSSWLDVLVKFRNYLSNELSINLPNAYINSQGYAQLVISDFRVMRLLKNYALKFQLPILRRKWNKIDLNYQSRTERKIKNKKLALEYYNLGFKNKEISHMLKVSPAAVTGYLKEVP